MPRNLLVSNFVRMNVMCTDALRVLFPEVPSRWDPEFSLCFVPDRLQSAGLFIHEIQVLDHNEYVDDRLRKTTGKGSAPDVMNGHSIIAKRNEKPLGLEMKMFDPCWIVWDDNNFSEHRRGLNHETARNY